MSPTDTLTRAAEPRFKLEVDVADVTSPTLAKDVDDALAREYGTEIPAELEPDVKRAKAGVVEFARALVKQHGPGPATFRLEQAASGAIQVQVYREATKTRGSIASATVLLEPPAAAPVAAPPKMGPPPAVLPQKPQPKAPTPPPASKAAPPGSVRQTVPKR